ncbi:hypothetical protein CLPU_2c01410 [Gottschalkia purinilytica]|uniref:Uncharacterized protein n=1 Tax=Gottschalkia purinilytica TaxID=1503 RepID=A0A0L0WDY7_GOTPU|nr:hypothetical protein [Gottschalkia purinilytica]KNF09689.1 hypothetical protein CLPU_2c01410 [Gottschalkia purinilytica]
MRYIYINLGNLDTNKKTNLLNYYFDKSDLIIAYINREYENEIYNKIMKIDNIHEEKHDSLKSKLSIKVNDDVKKVMFNNDLFAYDIIKDSKIIVSLSDWEDFVIENIYDNDIKSLHDIGLDNKDFDVYDTPKETIITDFDENLINTLIDELKKI